MQFEEDEIVGGRTAWVGPADDLDEVPEPFARLVTPVVREVFADPRQYFRAVADRSPFPNMTKWLRAITHPRRCRWILMLEQGEPEEYRRAGFSLGTKSLSGAILGPPDAHEPGKYPKGLADLYALVGFVDWMSLMCAGKLFGPGGHPPLTEFPNTYHGEPIDPETTRMFGDSPCGDMMVYTPDDRAGWACHESGHVHKLGSTADMVNWVFGELLAGRTPEYDYNWAA